MGCGGVVSRAEVLILIDIMALFIALCVTKSTAIWH